MCVFYTTCKHWPAGQFASCFSLFVGILINRGPWKGHLQWLPLSLGCFLRQKSRVHTAGFLAGRGVSRPFLFCPADSAALCNGCQPAQGGAGGCSGGASASGVHRGTLKIERQMLFFQRSICFMLKTDVDFFKKDYL